MKKELEHHPIQLDEVQAEKLVKDRMKTMDPGKVDFSEVFMNQLHDKIMAQVEQTEIQPKVANEKLPFRLRLWWQKSTANKTTALMMMALVMVMSGAMVSKATSQKAGAAAVSVAAANEDALLQEALKSPEAFEDMIAGSLGQNDFLVDVASRNFDHLNLNDFDTLFGTSTVGLSRGASFNLEETR